MLFSKTFIFLPLIIYYYIDIYSNFRYVKELLKYKILLHKSKYVPIFATELKINIVSPIKRIRI